MKQPVGTSAKPGEHFSPLSTIRLEMPANYHSLAVIQTCVETLLAQVGTREQREQLIYQVRLAVHETCTNIIRHAYGVGTSQSAGGASQSAGSGQTAVNDKKNGANGHGTASDLGEINNSQPDNTILITFHRLNHPPRLVIDLYDRGQSFAPESIPAPDLNQAQDSGYGLFLVRQLMDEVYYDSQPENNHWRLTKNLPEN